MTQDRVTWPHNVSLSLALCTRPCEACVNEVTFLSGVFATSEKVTRKNICQVKCSPTNIRCADSYIWCQIWMIEMSQDVYF